MAKCFDCKRETSDTVWEPNIRERVPLCKSCQKDNYRKCKECGQFYPKEEVDKETELCGTCRDL